MYVYLIFVSLNTCFGGNYSPTKTADTRYPAMQNDAPLSIIVSTGVKITSSSSHLSSKSSPYLLPPQAKTFPSSVRKSE